MVQEIFQQIKDLILLHNPYLVKGYANVTKDTTGYIIERVNGKDEYQRIFPNDRLGTYFYLRNEGLINFNFEPESIISDCTTGANVFQTPIRMVTVFEAQIDPFQLIQNITSTLALSQTRLAFVSAEWNAERIIDVEMTGSPAEDIAAAKQRGSLFSLMAFSLIATMPIEFLNTNCITNPCITC